MGLGGMGRGDRYLKDRRITELDEIDAVIALGALQRVEHSMHLHSDVLTERTRPCTSALGVHLHCRRMPQCGMQRE